MDFFPSFFFPFTLYHSLALEGWTMHTASNAHLSCDFFLCLTNREHLKERRVRSRERFLFISVASTGAGLRFYHSPLQFCVSGFQNTLPPLISLGRTKTYSHEAESIMTFLLLSPLCLHLYELSLCSTLAAQFKYSFGFLPRSWLIQGNSEKGLYILTLEKDL